MNIREVIKQLKVLLEEYGDDIEVKIQTGIFDTPKRVLDIGYDEEKNVVIIGWWIIESKLYRKEVRFLNFIFKVTGDKMKEPVFIEILSNTCLQAIFKAKEEVNKQNLEWDKIEYI